MRMLLTVVLVTMAIVVLGFYVTNTGNIVDVTLWNTMYTGVPIGTVVLIAVIFGAVCTAIIGVVEGMTTRLDNHRLKREIHRLETEINYLRTQPSTAVRSEPDAPPAATARPAASALPASTGVEPSSAPVYGTADDEWPPDPDDETYSGGRAV